MDALLALIEKFSPTDIIYGLGWVIAVGVVWFSTKKEAEHRLREVAHQARMDGLHDTVGKLQELRVDDANDNKDEFVALSQRVLDALDVIGVKKR